MKRFSYSLQALRTLRERAEQTALETYAKALSERQQRMQALAAIRGEQENWWRWRRAELEKACVAASLHQWQNCEQNLTQRRDLAEGALRQAEAAVESALRELRLARQRREAVDKHHQRQRSRYQRELGREEQKLLDECAQHRVAGRIREDMRSLC